MSKSKFELKAIHLVAALAIGLVAAFLSANEPTERERRPEFMSRAQRAQLDALDAAEAAENNGNG